MTASGVPPLTSAASVAAFLTGSDQIALSDRILFECPRNMCGVYYTPVNLHGSPALIGADGSSQCCIQIRHNLTG